MPGPNSNHTNGTVPTRLKCSICMEDKSQNFFSKQQIDKWLQHHSGGRSHNSRIKPKSKSKSTGDCFIRCWACTGGQQVEFNCRICRKTKGKDAFADAQKKDPDNAKCRDCMRATELVMPTAHLIDLEDADEEREDVVESSRSNNGGDHFYRDTAGQYWTGSNHDSASSVSNAWNSRAGSSVARGRGPISTIDTESQSDENESIYSDSTIHNTTRPDRNGISRNMIATTHQFGALNVEEESTANASLARLARLDGKSPAISEVDSDSDSDETTITVKDQGGVPLNLKASMSSISGEKATSNPMPNYDDSDGEEYDLLNTQLWKPIIKKQQQVNLYDSDDSKGEEYTDYPNTSNRDGRSTSGPGTAHSQTIHPSTSRVTTKTTTEQSLRTGSTMSFHSEDIDAEWAEVPVARTYASGFKPHKVKDGKVKKFARVRPTNLRVTDLGKSLLDRKDYVTEYTGRKKDYGEAGSDED